MNNTTAMLDCGEGLKKSFFNSGFVFKFPTYTTLMKLTIFTPAEFFSFSKFLFQLTTL